MCRARNRSALHPKAGESAIPAGRHRPCRRPTHTAVVVAEPLAEEGSLLAGGAAEKAISREGLLNLRRRLRGIKRTAHSHSIPRTYADVPDGVTGVGPPPPPPHMAKPPVGCGFRSSGLAAHAATGGVEQPQAPALTGRRLGK